jgi:hypothetical protein
MLKLLLICILVGYVLYKLGSSVKVYTHTNMHQAPPKRPTGSVHVDSAPEPKKQNREMKGGEYVDYEEVK